MLNLKSKNYLKEIQNYKHRKYIKSLELFKKKRSLITKFNKLKKKKTKTFTSNLAYLKHNHPLKIIKFTIPPLYFLFNPLTYFKKEINRVKNFINPINKKKNYKKNYISIMYENLFILSNNVHNMYLKRLKYIEINYIYIKTNFFKNKIIFKKYNPYYINKFIKIKLPKILKKKIIFKKKYFKIFLKKVLFIISVYNFLLKRKLNGNTIVFNFFKNFLKKKKIWFSNIKNINIKELADTSNEIKKPLPSYKDLLKLFTKTKKINETNKDVLKKPLDGVNINEYTLEEKKEFEFNDILFKSTDFNYSYFFYFKITKSVNFDYWLRFETFFTKKDTWIEGDENRFYDYVVENLPTQMSIGMDKKVIRLMYIYVKFAINSYKGLRHYFGLPVRGNRTWSNRRNPRKNQNFIEFCYQVYFPRRFGYVNKSKKKAILYAEILNKIYFIYFRIKWMEAKIRRIKYIQKGSYLEWRFDLRSLLANRVIILDEKQEKKLKKNKKKKQKKKYKIKKHFFNMGFDFNFTRSRSMEKRMFKGFFVVKRSFIPKKKKKKKK